MKKLWDLKKVLSNLEMEGQGRGIIMGVTHPLLLGPFYYLHSSLLGYVIIWLTLYVWNSVIFFCVLCRSLTVMRGQAKIMGKVKIGWISFWQIFFFHRTGSSEAKLLNMYYKKIISENSFNLIRFYHTQNLITS